MMGSKASFVVLGLVLAVFLLVSSEVANARDVAKVVSKEDPAGVEDGKYGGYGGGGHGGYGGGGHGGYGGGGHGGYGGGGHGGYGGGRHGGHGGGGYGGGGHGGGGHGGGGCRYGCCYKGYYGCSKCCSYAGQVPDDQVQSNQDAETHN
ncbi:hypothetical protein H6P81_008041 [Aristolochia fimbriata]|uniref:Glycine-rich protein n=1 Tax=Aristolochia fimbriata TaxID=158543 RepID=A0AAV7F233_ARIFI|nr:hypothetical protein H6P81_008041 [Aristolochia fimbriata]